MEIIFDILDKCIPIIVGALIAIIPTMIQKHSEHRYDKEEKQYQKKQELYVELISLFGKVLKNPCDSDLNMLRDHINLISITGSVEVVKALNEYLDTWSRTSGKEQNQKYSSLLKVLRVDLGIDDKINERFPEIGLRDINIQK